VAVSASSADDDDDDEEDDGNDDEIELHDARAQRRAAASVGASNDDDDKEDDDGPGEAEAAHTRSMATERSSERHPSSDADADDERAGANAKAGLVHTGASSPNNDMEIEPRVPVICARISKCPNKKNQVKRQKRNERGAERRQTHEIQKRLTIRITALKNNGTHQQFVA
jgi:hypothetical protein